MSFRIFSLLLYGAAGLYGQNILYNQQRDKLAQDTVTAAKQVTSGTVSAAEMHNLGVIEQTQLDSAMAWYRVTMRANIQAFRRWREVKAAIDDIRKELEQREAALGLAPRVGATAADLNRELAAVKIRADALQARASQAKTAARDAVMKAAAPTKKTAKTPEKAANAANQAPAATPKKEEPPALSADLEALGKQVGQFDELIGWAQQLTGGLKSVSGDQGLDKASGQLQAAQKAVEDIQKGIQEVQELAKTVESIIGSWKDLKVDPASLAPSPEKIAIELLQREAEYIKALTAIRVRRALEVAEMRALLQRFDVEFARCRFSTAELETQVTDDLARFVGVAATRITLEQRMYALLLAAQLAARQTGGQTVNDLRESMEYRRLQVSRNSVYNGSYETALQAAAQRLAAYYASGLKPTQLAQFVYQLSTAVALPYVSVTK